VPGAREVAGETWGGVPPRSVKDGRPAWLRSPPRLPHTHVMRSVVLLATLSGVACAKQGAPRPLAVGEPVPTVSLESSDGRRLSLADLRGKKVLLWFYPKADTPG
jgi:hypothetical protein